MFSLLLTLFSLNLVNCSSKNLNSNINKKSITAINQYNIHLSINELKKIMIDFTGCFDVNQCSYGRAIESLGIDNARKFIERYNRKYVTKNVIKQEVPYRYIFQKSWKYIPDTKFKNYNIITLIKPKKKVSNKYIIFSAHYDHEGINEEGKIMYGADDNASGVIALLKISEIIQKMDSKNPFLNYNIMFLYCTAEESGLIGSQYFVENLPIINNKKMQLSDILLNINIDMIGRNCNVKDLENYKTIAEKQSKCTQKNKPFLILTGYVSEKHLKKNSIKRELQKYTRNNIANFKKKLDKIIFNTVRANNILGNPISKIDYKTHHLRNKSQWIYRTDSYNFYSKGIPSIFFSGGDHPDYHQPTDTFEKIRWNIYINRIKIILKTFELLNSNLDL